MTAAQGPAQAADGSSDGQPDESPQAFLDESGSDSVRDPDTYVLAAAVCVPVYIDDNRAGMERLRLPGQRKVHWRDEDDKRRRLVTEQIAAMPIQHLVVVRDGLTGEAPERRRRLCLEQMLFRLDELAVRSATFESRGPHDDTRDRHMLDALRARKVVSSRLRIAHTPGMKDPMLWVPDAVCGAISQDRTGNSAYLEILQTHVEVEIITISAR